MKRIVSFSIKEETMGKMQEKLRNNNTYRNKSHLVECALEKFLEEGK